MLMPPISRKFPLQAERIYSRFLMRKLLFLAFVLILATAGDIKVRSQSQSVSASDVIIAAEHAWANAAVERNIEAFAKCMSDDYRLITVNTGPDKKSEFDLRTKPQWVEMVRSGREKYDRVEIYNLQVLFNGDIATVTGEYSQKGTSDGKDISAAGLYVDTWVKRQGQWQLVSSVFP